MVQCTDSVRFQDLNAYESDTYDWRIFQSAIKCALQHGWSKEKMIAFGKVRGNDKSTCEAQIRQDIVRAIRLVPSCSQFFFLF